MKILQVTAFFSPVHGGSSEVPYQISKELALKGHEVTIYTSDFMMSPDYINAVPPSVKVYPFKTWFHPASMYITPGMVKVGKEIRHFDVMHMHNYRTFQNILAYRYARKYGVPYVLQAHGSLPRIMSRVALKRAYDCIWGYRLLKDASKVIAVTGMEVEQYKSMGVSEDKITIVPNGINLAEFDSLPARGEFRQKYGLDSSLPIILYLGRIHKIKGLELLAEAFADLLRKSGNIMLVIAGPDDGYLSSLKGLMRELGVEDKVLFTGPLYGKDKLRAYVDADIFVNPRADEIFGLVFLEALACGTPVICSEGCGIADVIDGQAGLAVPYDKDALCRAISNMLYNDEMRHEFGQSGKRLVHQKFDWVKIADQMEDIYQNIGK